MSIFRRRTRLFIAKKFQIRYISLIMVLMFATGLLTGYMVYVTTWTMFGEKLAEVYPQGLLFDIVKQVNMVLLLRFIFLSPIVMLIGLVLSNRIAGPLYSIKRFVKRISRGYYGYRLELRKGDELQDLSRMLNHLASRLESDRTRRINQIEYIKERLTELRDDVDSGSSSNDEIIKKIDRLSREVKGLA